MNPGEVTALALLVAGLPIALFLLGLRIYVLRRTLRRRLRKHVPTTTTCSLKPRSEVSKVSVVHGTLNKIWLCLDIFGDLKELWNSRVSKKTVTPCEHIQEGAKPYSYMKCERFILKEGSYILKSYVEQEVCFSCSKTASF